MPQLLIALAIVIGGIWFIRKSARLKPSQTKDFTKKAGALGLIALATLLLLRGSVNAALTALALGLGLLGSSFARSFRSPFAQKEKSQGQQSEVTTDLLKMTLDHDSGVMTGQIVKGPYAKRSLESLQPDELQNFYNYCAKTNTQSLQLLEAWLNRHQPEWGENWQAGHAASPPSHPPHLSEAEALAILGLKKGAGEADIRAAHRRLMKDYHPDHGGSDYLATQINLAKDVLLHD